jgi:uncharacterized protein HemY
MIERLLAAEAAMDRDELDVAERHFTLVSEADPRNAMAVVGLARVAQRRGDPVSARALATRALGIDPIEAAARRLLDELDRTANNQPANAESAPMSTPMPGPRPWWRRILDRLRGRS